MNIDAFIDEYLVSRSQETEKAYRSDLKKFEAFLVEQGLTVEAARPTHIRAFVNWLAARRNTRTKRRGLSEDTIKRHVSAVRAYYEWLRFSNPLLLDPTSFFHFRRVRMRRKVLGIPAEVVDRMCAADEKEEAAIVLLFRRSGVRLSELIALNRNSFEIFPATAQAPAHARLVVLGKGGKTRTVLVSEDAVNAVRGYLRERRDKDPALFLSSRGRISKRTVQRMIQRLGSGCGCDDAHVHRLRHGFATDMLEGDMRIEVLQKLMGHEKPETTLSYVDSLERNTARQYHAVLDVILCRDVAIGAPVQPAGKRLERSGAVLQNRRNGRLFPKATGATHSGRHRAA